MINKIENTNEQLSASAFTKQSEIFDSIYSPNTIIRYKRERVRNHVGMFLQPSDKILELNAGTGEDAIYFAKHFHRVHATDVSEGMLKVLRNKISETDIKEIITTELCSFTQLENLTDNGPYNYIFSNFAGLNCTDQLDKVLSSLKPLLQKKGVVTLVIMPPFCLWESLLIFKGNFRTALRRSKSKNGADAHIEGIQFKCWYYKPSFIVDKLKKDFDLISLEGLCTLVPPSYLEHFAEKYPRIFKILLHLESRWKSSWPWKYIGDYFIITLRKK